jgi:hypothetical protein
MSQYSLLSATLRFMDYPSSNLPTRTRSELASTMRVGDLVFIRIRFPPFTAISSATGTWTNHVGVVVDFNTDLRLWKIWYFGKIPWARRTITPASLYLDPTLQVAFDGRLRAPARIHPS